MSTSVLDSVSAVGVMRAVESAPIIELKNVCMVFKSNAGKDVEALRDVSMDIRKGEFVSLLGPSGCGKTTLLRIIADLLEPTSGAVSISGRTPRQTRLQQKYGIVFQNPVLFDWRTVRGNVRLPLEIMRVHKEEQDRRIDR